MKRGYIFDLFGTLVEHPSVSGIRGKIFPEIDYMEMIKPFIHILDFGTKERCLEAIAGKFGLALDDSRKDEMLTALDEWERNVKPIEGALKTLAALKERGVKTALISNANNLIEGALARTGIDKRLDIVVFSHKVGIAKPDVEIFRWCLGKMGLESENLAMIGDQMELDIAPAESIGIRGILFDPRGAHPDYKHRVASLQELLDYSF
ncbi:MAG: hypothetical protein Kow0090_18300 [Myxococcota bacterium]